jgi:hypothetical protein
MSEQGIFREPRGCDFAMDPTASVHRILRKIEYCASETLAMIRQAFGKESLSRIRNSPNTETLLFCVFPIENKTERPPF